MWAAGLSLSKWEQRGLVVLAGLVVHFGVLVEIRSAFLARRMANLDVNLRAAWAIRTGRDFYAITDDNHQWQK